MRNKNLFSYYPASSHALTYTWLEERKIKRAESTAVRLQKQYPYNIINLQLLGRIYMYQNRFAKSEQTFKRVLNIDSKTEGFTIISVGYT